MKEFTTPPSKIIVHISDSYWGTEKDIRDWHVRGNKWDETGYHYVILNGQFSSDDFMNILDGQISPARPLNYQGAHCRGQNSDSLGICLISKDGVITTEQIKSLVKLIDTLDSYFNKTFTVHPHNEFDSSKTCPGFDVPTILNDGKNLLGSKRETLDQKLADMSIRDFIIKLKEEL
tara:strand:+ start:70 stop:597 length:528 start_codon:yes stop_codon:yes gene_type:complete